MHPLVAQFVSRTVIGLVVILVGVPYLQNRTLVLSTSAGPVLTVTGDVSGLVPGELGELLLTVHNDGGASTVVRHLSAVPAKQVSGCTISVASWAGEVHVPAGGATTQPLVVRLSGARCGGASWALSYAATA